MSKRKPKSSVRETQGALAVTPEAAAPMVADTQPATVSAADILNLKLAKALGA
jgi:hypothetical protein